MKRFFFGTLGVLLGGLSVACSGVDGNGLLADTGSPQNDGSSQDDGSVGPDVITTIDSGLEEGHDANVVDAAPDVPIGPADSKIQCGPSSLSCSAQKEVCCWHQSSTSNPFECVTSLNSCSGLYDVPMTCSSTDNCASQGNPTHQCCATGGNAGSGQCWSYDVASVVACKATCEVTDYEIGCSVKQQNCTDSLQTCVTSKCTVPGDTMCY